MITGILLRRIINYNYRMNIFIVFQKVYKDSNLRRLNSHSDESVFFCHRQNNSFDKFLDLWIKSADVCVLLGRTLIDLKSPNSRIIFSWQFIENEIRVFINPHKVTRGQFFCWHEANDGKKIGLPCRGFNNGSLSLSLKNKLNHGSAPGRDGNVAFLEAYIIQTRSRLLINGLK